MMLSGTPAAVIAAITGTLCVAWHGRPDYASSYGSINTGLTFLPKLVGYCSQGICMTNQTSEGTSCNDLHNHEGYLTRCTSLTCDGMPCIVWPRLHCYHLSYVPRHGWEYRFYPEGTPCWLKNYHYCLEALYLIKLL
ncbi:uncharacterized protein LOC142768493 isoform X2 [Rhipicephalus microplus]|uniref:uncharacterized protein LOC142768493 isoform X2 n=1 Tax=Rhipicephalus microplus TaxID=6941 RepID=UPI003F6ACE8E